MNSSKLIQEQVSMFQESLAKVSPAKQCLASQKLDILRDRGVMLAACRQFFQDKGVLEVDCPYITRKASIDTHIDLIEVVDSPLRYLHTSPEYCMKRLLSEGIGDIYQLGHVFRKGEYSSKHNPEFTMAEWYREGLSFEGMIEETIEFIQLFLGKIPHKVMSYRDVFIKYLGIDYLKATDEMLLAYMNSRSLSPYPGAEEEGKDGLLNILLGSFIEPSLGTEGELLVLAYYPSSQAALARTCVRDGENVAKRFEIYYQGVELCNGYHELLDAKELEKRFKERNAMRLKLGKNALPIDESFLQAIDKGLPDASGVAVGFDRLMMLRHKADCLAKVLPFDWENA